MIAVFVNCAVVVIGSLIGVLFSKKISDAMSDVVSAAAGLLSLVLGVQMALGFSNIVYLALSLIVGGMAGTAIDIDKRIFELGKLLERLVTRKKTQDVSGKKNFAKAFLSASVLFCVGAMTVLGSLQAGIQKDYTIIFTKSVLDGFMSMIFAAAMGIGTAFAAVSVLVVQGLLTLFASSIAPFMSEQMIGEVSAAGGVMIIMIALGLTNIKSIKTANYLPALFVIALFVLADPFITKLMPF